MRARNAIAFIALLLCAGARADVDRAAAQRAFDAFERNCARDHGTLWGLSLCGKIVVVDPRTRDAFANDGWSGKLPEEIGIANTAFDWRDGRWSMVRWPLPGDEGARDRLLLHERFHAIQDRIGLPASPAAGNAHLDTLEGRSLMRLEMRALRDALLKLRESTREARERVADALAFRRERFQKFKDAAESEAALDRNEGMAEYTGVRLFTTDRDRVIDTAAAALADADQSDALARSYAYATGPAWGVLLDTFAPNWRKEIAHSTYDKLMEPRLGPGKRRLKPVLHSDRYGGAELLADEQKREQERQARIASYEQRFVKGPALVLPLRQMSMQFDPHDVHPFEGHGTVYEHITISDVWGKIVVTGGALISSDYRTLTVAVGGYELKLAPGWRLTVEKAQ
jgi:hypothetical protein